MAPTATYEEVDNLGPPELRFRQACQFYTLFDGHHGESVDPLDTRFFWMCYADAFLMMIVSLKDFISWQQKTAFNGNDLLRMITVLRNVTVHKAVVSTASPLIMINRNISLNVGGPRIRREDAVLNVARIAEALDHYESEIRRTPRLRGEQHNIDGARRWNDGLKAAGTTTIGLSQVFSEALTAVAGICGFTMPELDT